MPTYVGEEVGGSSYLVAAAPVRAGGREGIVTVPQTLQRQESERQTDELDRLVSLPRCCSSCSARGSDTGWRSGSPTR